MKTIKFYTIFCSAVLLFFTCKNDDKVIEQLQNNTPDTDGIGYTETNEAPAAIYSSILSILNSNSNIGIVAEVNHSANAQNAGLNLEYTRTVYFGNPALGTPLMQNNIQAGLDLPQRITVYTDEDGDTVVAYNSVQYLIDRHNLGTVATTDMIATALATIVNTATGQDVTLNAVDDDTANGIITVLSANNFDTTYNNIINTLSANENISIVAQLDHQANAQSVDLELSPSKLIIFGNPALGTPLMAEERTTALDLPQKILVYESSNGDVAISYNDPFYIANRHDIDNNNEILNTISQALQNISTAGASED